MTQREKSCEESNDVIKAGVAATSIQNEKLCNSPMKLCLR